MYTTEGLDSNLLEYVAYKYFTTASNNGKIHYHFCYVLKDPKLKEVKLLEKRDVLIMFHNICKACIGDFGLNKMYRGSKGGMWSLQPRLKTASREEWLEAVVGNLKSRDPEAIFSPFDEILTTTPMHSVTTTKTKTIKTSYNAPPTIRDYEVVYEGNIWKNEEDKSEKSSTGKFSPLYTNERNPLGSPGHDFYGKNEKSTTIPKKELGKSKDNNFSSNNMGVDWNTPGSHLLNLIPNQPKPKSPKREDKRKTAARIMPGVEKKKGITDPLEDSEMEDVSQYFTDGGNGSKEKKRSNSDEEKKQLVNEVASLKQMVSDLVSGQKKNNVDVAFLADQVKKSNTESISNFSSCALKNVIEEAFKNYSSTLDLRFSHIEKELSKLRKREPSPSPKSVKKND